MPKNKRVLVLNADFLPLGIIDWKRAVTLSIINDNDPKHEKGLIVIDYYDKDYIKASAERHLPVPAVVRLPRYISKHGTKIPFSRKNVYLRDKMTCQYCGFYDGTSNHLTYDHVIPRTKWKKLKYKGTPTQWQNIVTCCFRCNKRKADRTPKESGMQLLKTPKSPNAFQYILGLSPWCKIPKEWEPYLTPLYKHLIKISKPDIFE